MILIALIAFAIPVFADTIDYSGAGSLSNGTARISGKLSAGSTWAVLDNLIEVNDETTGKIMQGQLGSVDIVTGTLTKCGTMLCFNGGDLDIRSTTGAVLFKGAFTSGTISKMGGSTFLNAVMPSGATVLLKDAHGNFSSDSTITTRLAHTPEPSALFLMGTGILALSWLRWKLA